MTTGSRDYLIASGGDLAIPYERLCGGRVSAEMYLIQPEREQRVRSGHACASWSRAEPKKGVLDRGSS